MNRNAAVSYPARRWWILAALCLALLTLSVDNTILNVALPTIERDLDATSGELQWLVDSYLLVFAGLILTAGTLGDRFGRKRALLAGLAIFGAASAASALAQSADVLIATRALMGVGAALIMPTTLSILTHVFPPDERGKAIGIWAAVFGLGVAVGPSSGGLLLEHFAWSAIFLVNVPIVLASLVVIPRLIPESRDEAAPPVDTRGALLSIGALTALVYGIVDAPDAGWGSAQTLALFTAAAVLLGVFAAHERRTAHPMLDVRLLRDPRFSVASGGLGLSTFALFGVLFFATQHLQGVLGYDALEAGLRVLPVAAGMLVAAPLSHAVVARLGVRVTVAAGFALVAVGCALFLRADVAAGYGAVWPAMVVAALGTGLAMPPATDSVMGAVGLAKAGVGSAMNDTSRLVGGALGVAVVGSVLSTGYRGGMQDAPQAAQDSLGAALQLGDPALRAQAADAFVTGMHDATLVAAAVAALAAVLAVTLLPRRVATPALEPAAA